MSFFRSVELLPDDPILKLPIAFAADTRKLKVNLGIGVYKNAQGQSHVLSCVRKAEEKLIQSQLNKEYLPIQGDQNYIQECTKLILGQDCEERMFVAQSVGGTSALRIGGDLIFFNKLTPNLFVADPTWPNHHQIFSRAGFNVQTHPYYDHSRKGLNFSGMCESLSKMPQNSVILLQACCHNPTGLDPSLTQWKEISALIKKRQLVPFFDLAYQGFGTSLEDDARIVRLFAEEGHEMLVAWSGSKNFGLYGERVGLIAFICKDKDIAKKVGSQIKQIIRCTYSMSPLHGVRIVGTILQTKELRDLWVAELAEMRDRIGEMRKLFAAKLGAKMPQIDFSFLNNQTGMFSFSGLSEEQVKKLQTDFGIYLPTNGRINVAGLNLQNIDYVVDAFASLNK